MLTSAYLFLLDSTADAAARLAVIGCPPQTGPDASTWIALIAGILVIILVLMRRRLLRQRMSRQSLAQPSRHLSTTSARHQTKPTRADVSNIAATASLTAGATTAGGAERRQLNDSMQQLMLDLEEMSRQVGGQIDTRLRALNLLIEEADRKIAELRQLGLATGAETAASATPAKSAANTVAAQPGTRPAAAEPVAANDKYGRVYALAAQGMSVVEIAREMGMMTGEVELILALRRTAAGRSEGASA